MFGAESRELRYSTFCANTRARSSVKDELIALADEKGAVLWKRSEA